jgi:acylphosphatase
MPGRGQLGHEIAMAKTRAHVLISGRVQGVSFRYETYREARRHGVVGWVRNLADGRVEALFEGEADAVRRLVQWCHAGPPGAHVEGVETAWTGPTGEFDDFGIERTPVG